MADPWTPPEQGPSEQSSRTFSRQALEATLAEALRDAESSGAAVDTDEAPQADNSEKSPIRRPNPFGRPMTPEPGAPPRPVTPQPGASPRPIGGLKDLVQGTLSGSTRLQPPSSNNGGGANLGSLRPPGLSDLTGSRTVSGYAQGSEEAPAPQATIALRRPKRSEAQSSSVAEAEPTPPPAPVPHPAPKQMVPIAAWTPADDDILPKGPVKRRSFRLKR